ncbi:hypothetical protein PO909_005831, partial [Leuciscus waleckii]
SELQRSSPSLATGHLGITWGGARRSDHTLNPLDLTLQRWSWTRSSSTNDVQSIEGKLAERGYALLNESRMCCTDGKSFPRTDYLKHLRIGPLHVVFLLRVHEATPSLASRHPSVV